MSAEERHLQYHINGVQTIVRVVGSGAPIIVLHGASTLEGMDAMDAISEHFTILYPSHPGMGDSGDAGHIVDMMDMLVHYLNLFDAMNLPEKPHLAGFSMGGWMASELAGLAHERFNKLILVAPAELNDPAHPAADLASIPLPELPGYLAHNIEIALRYFPDGSNQQGMQAFIFARERENNMVARLMSAHGMGHPNLRHFLRRISNQTLLVWGENDRRLPASQAHIWIDEIPDSQLLAVPDAGHFVLLEQPWITKNIQEFLLSPST